MASFIQLLVGSDEIKCYPLACRHTYELILPGAVALNHFKWREVMKVFVPITDEFLYRTPEKISNELVPYDPDYPCYRWLVDRSFETTAVSKQENRYTLGTRPEMPPAATHTGQEPFPPACRGPVIC
jgi:hypothetical protein